MAVKTDVVLLADAGDVTVARRTAFYTYGKFEVILPEGREQQETDNRIEDGYIARAHDGNVGRFDFGFIRADATVNIDAGTSDLETQIDSAELRAEGDVFFEGDITPSGFNGFIPGVDYDSGDIVTVRRWGTSLALPVTSIELEVSESAGTRASRVHVSGQLIHDAASRRRSNDDLRQQIAAEKRERLRQVGAVDKKATTAQEKADTADENAGKAQEKADTADGKAGQAQEKADAADEKAGQAQEKADALEIQLDPIMDFAQSYMPTGLGFNGSGRLPFRVQRGPAKGVGVENDGMRLLGAGAWQITCEVTASWVRVATRRIVYRVNCYNPQGDLYAYQEFIDDTSEESHTVAFGADFVVPEPNYFVTVHVNSVGIGRKHLGGWAATRLVAKRWSSEFINPPDGGAAETEPTP